MSHIENPAKAIHGNAAFPELPDEHVDADAVGRDVARDDEVLRALAPVLLPEPAQVTRINVDIENGVDAVVEGGLRHRIPSVRPRTVDYDPLSDKILRFPHPHDDFCKRLFELGERV